MRRVAAAQLEGSDVSVSAVPVSVHAAGDCGKAHSRWLQRWMRHRVFCADVLYVLDFL